MGNFVDGLRVGGARVMPNSEREVAEREPFAVADETEDHAELAVRVREIDLETGGKTRAVAPLGLAAAQDLELDAVSLELATRAAQRLSSRAATSHRVLGEGALVEEDASMAPPDG